MKISKRGLELIKKYEGFFGKPYKDPIGIPTIGYGATYYPESGVKVKLTDKPMTEAQASAMLVRQLESYEKSIEKLVKKPINQNQFDALVSFTFNLGATNLGKSTLLKKVNINPNDPTIRTEFDKWVNAGGKKFNGLVKRRKDEAALYFS